MKKTVFLAVFLLICLCAAPILADYLTDKQSHNLITPSNVKEITSAQESTSLPITQAAEETPEEKILVCLATSGAVESVPLKEYVIGVVAGEMPALYEPQALCAQAAASLNLARLALLDGTSERLGGGHISSSSTEAQAYLTEAQMRDKWGTDFELFYARIAEAVDTVFDYEIVYEDTLCRTCFHAVSAGKTENSENVWQSAVPYLTAVDSSFDASADNYSVSVQLHADTFAEGLKPYGFVPTQTARLWLGNSTYSDSGTLLALEVGNITVSGAELRKAFGLRSAAVDVIYEDGEFILIAKGYGHGVGMSQYGAQQLALQGKTWQEIIQHYYTGVEIRKRG